MFKILSVSMLILLFVGCVGTTKKMSMTHAPFQTVNKEDATLVQLGQEKDSCIICGMNLVRFYKTSHSAQIKNKHYQYCSIHCLEEHLGEGVELKNPKVVDVKSLKLISVQNVYYVVGSSKRGTMSRVSKYAFKDKEDAMSFKEQYGGEIMDFYGALEIAREDFKHYKN